MIRQYEMKQIPGMNFNQIHRGPTKQINNNNKFQSHDSPIVTRNVKMEESRKHHHFLSIKHSSSDKTGFSVGMEVSGVDITVEDDIFRRF